MLERRIKGVIAETIRPMLQSHGGNLEYLGFDSHSGSVMVVLTGSCDTCPFAQETLKERVEEVLRKAIPEVKRVVRQG